MDWVIYFFGSGAAFFAGIGCILSALAVSFGRWRGWTSLSTIAALFGLILVTLSGTPLPTWFYVIAILVTVIWLVVARWSSIMSSRGKIGLCSLVAAAWIVGTAVELPYQLSPFVAPSASRRLYLFGDSISAGINENDANTWPKLLRSDHSIELTDYSRAGATVAVALRRANDATLGDGVVLLEIGGNDLLGSTTDVDFARTLDQLLRRVCQPGRQVLMFELPLPPFRNADGKIQRRLAAQYHVLLIPKRVLVGVLTSGGGTLDSIHLSPAGHQRMAEVVWQIIQPAYEQ